MSIRSPGAWLRRLSLTCGLIGYAGQDASAGAFNQLEGHGVVIVTSTFSRADQGYDALGRVNSASHFRKFETNALLEYGVTDWLMAIVKPSVLAMRSSGVAPSSYEGLGMTEIGGQARLLQFDSFVVAAQSTLRVPGSTDMSNPILAGMLRTEVDARLLFGYGFNIGGWNSFVDLQVGYRWRAGGPPDEAHIDATLGTRPRDDLLLLLQSFSTISQSSNSLIFPTNRLNKIQASVVYEFAPQWSAQVGMFTAVTGRNALEESGVLAALWRRF